MISFDSWRTPLQLIDNKLQLDVNGLKVALIKKGLRQKGAAMLSEEGGLKVALIKKGLRPILKSRFVPSRCLKVALIKKGLRQSSFDKRWSSCTV